MTLQSFGFKEPFISQTNELVKLPTFTHCIAGRIILEHKHSYRVKTAQGEWLGTISGNFAFNAQLRKDYPAVGDWVLVEKMPGEEKCIIHKLLERQSVFSRKMAGLELDEQIVAANIDILMIVMSLNHDFNERRLERYMTAAWNSGATPIIVLTKMDLCEDVEAFLEKTQSIAFGVDIYAISTLTGHGVERLTQLLQPNKTAALIGSSGVGKSTLTNALIEQDKMIVQGIREDDSRGRHTTTHRELFSLPSGGIIIDTPGMRELQLWDTGDALDSSFSDIDSLSEQCRFRDCSHKKEPGCAVQQAIKTGELTNERYASYLKLQKEIAYIDKKIKTQAILVERQQSKKMTKQSTRREKNFDK
ncbi:MAG: ribosome small subunit-dependent GTPase A [Kurthia sp.]|nr:ribosome small subunit-dependent GTPase A [Candidatus Kurthia equi]